MSPKIGTQRLREKLYMVSGVRSGGRNVSYFDGAAVAPAEEHPRNCEAVCHHVRSASLGDLLPKAWPLVHMNGSAHMSSLCSNPGGFSVILVGSIEEEVRKKVREGQRDQVSWFKLPGLG